MKVVTAAALLLVPLLIVPSVASAALGGDASSIDVDRAHAKAALVRITRADTHAVHEMQAPSGTAVREYVSAAGKVFGVAWQGPWMPDLQQLLGSYYEQYRSLAMRQGRRRRGSLAIDMPELVIHVSGHARAFSGSAYVPSLMPVGVEPASVQ